VGFYAYYRHAVFSPLTQRVNFDKHGMQLSKLSVASNGSVTFKLYENQGPDVGALYIVSAKLVDTSDGSVVEKWNHEKLSNLPQGDITNQFRQPWAAQARTAPYGLSIITGAKARLTLPASSPDMSVPAGHYKLVLESVDGKEFSIDDR